LPAEPACERIEILGVVKSDPPGAKAELTLLASDMAELVAPPPLAGTPVDPDDIDHLEKLAPPTADGTAIAAAPSPVPLPSASAPVLRVVRTASSQVGIIAVDPARESMVTTMVDKVVEGSYLNNTYRNGQGVPQILIGDQLARILMVKPGDRLGLDILTRDGFPMDEMVEVAGMFNSGMDSMDRCLTFVHLGMAWDPELMNLVDPQTKAPQIHELAIRIREGLDNIAVAGRLQRRLASLKLSAWPWQKVEPAMASMVKLQDASVAILLLIIFAIAALGTMNTMLMSVFERIREFGVLKSVGMRPFFVARLILLETFLMTLVSMVVGGALGLLFTYYLVVHGLDLSSFVPEGFSYQGVVIDPVWRAVISVRSVVVPLVLMSLVSLIVAVWPAVRAARIKPVEALRQTGV
jgi:ABC-type lipoprotein release transport system permease subunit